MRSRNWNCGSQGQTKPVLPRKYPARATWKQESRSHHQHQSPSCQRGKRFQERPYTPECTECLATEILKRVILKIKQPLGLTGIRPIGVERRAAKIRFLQHNAHGTQSGIQYVLMGHLTFGPTPNQMNFSVGRLICKAVYKSRGSILG